SPAALAVANAHDTFGRDNDGDVILLFTAKAGIAHSPSFDKIKKYLDSLKTDHSDHVDAVTSYIDKRNAQLISKDGTTAFAAVSLRGDGEHTP
ncbi:hypothetical protein BT095_11700, partial [Corynebacterium diphtheriae]